MSLSTMIFTSSSKLVLFGFQPNLAFAFVGSPNSLRFLRAYYLNFVKQRIHLVCFYLYRILAPCILTSFHTLSGESSLYFVKQGPGPCFTEDFSTSA